MARFPFDHEDQEEYDDIDSLDELDSFGDDDGMDFGNDFFDI